MSHFVHNHATVGELMRRSRASEIQVDAERIVFRFAGGGEFVYRRASDDTVKGILAGVAAWRERVPAPPREVAEPPEVSPLESTPPARGVKRGAKAPMPRRKGRG